MLRTPLSALRECWEIRGSDSHLEKAALSDWDGQKLLRQGSGSGLGLGRVYAFMRY